MPVQVAQQRDRLLRQLDRVGGVGAGNQGRPGSGGLGRELRLGTARPYLGLAPYLLGKRFDDPSFTLRLAEKDVSLALEAGRASHVLMPVANAAHQTYLRALGTGSGRTVVSGHVAGARGGGWHRDFHHSTRRWGTLRPSERAELTAHRSPCGRSPGVHGVFLVWRQRCARCQAQPGDQSITHLFGRNHVIEIVALAGVDG